MKYTKGEWETGKGVLKGADRYDQSHIMVVTKDNPGYIVAMCGYAGAEDENESIANAHLIAASPIGDELATAVLDASFDDYDDFLELKEIAKRFKAKATT